MTSQINEYSTLTAYTADAGVGRLTTKSSVSKIADTNKIIYDGVNCFVSRSNTKKGDAVLYDTTDSTIKFLASETVLKSQLPSTYVPIAVVFGKIGDKVMGLALANTSGGTWAIGYEVKLTSLTAGTDVVLTINSTDYTFTYSSSSTSSTLAAAINANTTVHSTYGWTAVADGNDVKMTCYHYNNNYMTIAAKSGCTIARRTPDVNYLYSYAGTENGNNADYIVRKNGVVTSWACCQIERAVIYWTGNGSTATGITLGSSTIVKPSVFNATDNPILFNAYGTYENYLFQEHWCKYPDYRYTFRRSGKNNTAILGGITCTDTDGNTVYAYPPAHNCLLYSTSGTTAGDWWLPSSEEMYIMIEDTKIDNSDAINTTLTALGGGNLVAASYYWTSCEYNVNLAFLYLGTIGMLNAGYKHNSNNVRPVTAF